MSSLAIALSPLSSVVSSNSLEIDSIFLSKSGRDAQAIFLVIIVQAGAASREAKFAIWD